MKRAKQAFASHHDEWDPMLLLLVLQVARAQRLRGRDSSEWVERDALLRLVDIVAPRGRDALSHGWAEHAAQRGLLELRASDGETTMRLTSAARRMFRF